MGGLKKGWCLCGSNASQEDRTGVSVENKGGAIVKINFSGTGILIHRALVLTTHGTLPSISAAEGSEIIITSSNTTDSKEYRKRLAPERFFVTNSVLDLTVVACDPTETDNVQPLCLQNSVAPALDFGSVVYLLGHQISEEQKENLVTGEGRITVGTDTLIKISTDGVTWRPGSAGFDMNGNLAFMICDPMKLDPSGLQKKRVSAAPFWKKGAPKQFGIPVPEIRHWLNQHWQGSIDELDKTGVPARLRLSSKEKYLGFSQSFTSSRNICRENEHSSRSSINSVILGNMEKDIEEEVSSAFRRPEDDDDDASSLSDCESDNLTRKNARSLSRPLNGDALGLPGISTERASATASKGKFLGKSMSFQSALGGSFHRNIQPKEQDERPMKCLKNLSKNNVSAVQKLTVTHNKSQTDSAQVNNNGVAFQEGLKEKKNARVSDKCLRQLMMNEETVPVHSPDKQKEKLHILDINFPPRSLSNLSPVKEAKPTILSPVKEAKLSILSTVKEAKPSICLETSNPEENNTGNVAIQGPSCANDDAVLHEEGRKSSEKPRNFSGQICFMSKFHTGDALEEERQLLKSLKLKEPLHVDSDGEENGENETEEECFTWVHCLPDYTLSPEYGSGKTLALKKSKEPGPNVEHLCLKNKNESEHPENELCGKSAVKMSGDILPKGQELEVKDSSSDCASVGDSGAAVTHVSSLLKRCYQLETESDVETMYSAETRESRNYSPRESTNGRSISNVRHKQSSMNATTKRGGQGWNFRVQRSAPNKPKASQQPRKSQVHPSCSRKISMQVASYKNSDYFGPTVSSIMKKRNVNAGSNKGNVSQRSPRWIF